MRKAIGIAATLCFALGLAVLLNEPITGWISQKQMEASVAEFEKNRASIQESPDVAEEESAAEENYSNLLTDMQNYNEALYASGQTGLVDAWSYEQPTFDLAKYGLATEVVGVLDIPAMEEKLPVYLGATEENMAKGAAVLGQTSMPVGGANTNCVIAGHRGYGSVAFFREIEKLQPGDFVYLTTYWEKMAYRVESTAVILPDDIQAILIQEGRELLTLVTCHPYATGTHRYAVYCTAAKDTASEDGGVDGAQNPHEAGPDAARSSSQEQTESSSSQSRIDLEQWLPFLAIPLIILSIAILAWPSRKKQAAKKEGGTKQ